MRQLSAFGKVPESCWCILCCPERGLSLVVAVREMIFTIQAMTTEVTGEAVRIGLSNRKKAGRCHKTRRSSTCGRLFGVATFRRYSLLTARTSYREIGAS